jgi:hypothetical protein
VQDWFGYLECRTVRFILALILLIVVMGSSAQQNGKTEGQGAK